jgi:hypothetical protein
MEKANLVLALLLALPVAAVTGPARAADTYPPPYPRPNATKLMDNERINAWDVYWIKNQPTPMHTHQIDQFSITLAAGLLHTRRPDAEWTKPNMSKVGSVTFVPAGTTHQEEGLSDVPQHKIMLEIKPSPDNSGSHGTQPGESATKLFENPRLVAWDMNWKPGEKIARPAETLDTVTMFIEGGTLNNVAHKMGDAVFSHATPAHTETASAGSPHVVVVELK